MWRQTRRRTQLLARARHSCPLKLSTKYFLLLQVNKIFKSLVKKLKCKWLNTSSITSAFVFVYNQKKWGFSIHFTIFLFVYSACSRIRGYLTNLLLKTERAHILHQWNQLIPTLESEVYEFNQQVVRKNDLSNWHISNGIMPQLLNVWNKWLFSVTDSQFRMENIPKHYLKRKQWAKYFHQIKNNWSW